MVARPRADIADARPPRRFGVRAVERPHAVSNGAQRKGPCRRLPCREQALKGDINPWMDRASAYQQWATDVTDSSAEQGLEVGSMGRRPAMACAWQRATRRVGSDPRCPGGQLAAQHGCEPVQRATAAQGSSVGVGPRCAWGSTHQVSRSRSRRWRWWLATGRHGSHRGVRTSDGLGPEGTLPHEGRSVEERRGGNGRSDAARLLTSGIRRGESSTVGRARWPGPGFGRGTGGPTRKTR